jgi:hypothetical protein
MTAPNLESLRRRTADACYIWHLEQTYFRNFHDREKPAFSRPV